MAAIEKADGNYARAAEAAEQSLAIRREHFPEQPAFQLEAMRIRADVTGGIADIDYAERSHRELIALSEEIFPSKHPELARDLNAFAAFLGSLRRYDEAEAIERRGRRYPQDGLWRGGRQIRLRPLTTSRVSSSSTARRRKRSGFIRQAVAIIDRLPDQEDFRALARLNLASALSVARQYEEALAVAEESIAMHKPLPPLAQRRLGALYGIKMQALAGLDRAKEAVAAGREMVATALGDTYEDASNLVAGFDGLFADPQGGRRGGGGARRGAAGHGDAAFQRSARAGSIATAPALWSGRPSRPPTDRFVRAET